MLCLILQVSLAKTLLKKRVNLLTTVGAYHREQVVEDQNVQDQNQAMEQDLDDQNLADEVQKAQDEENKVQTSILSFFKKKKIFTLELKFFQFWPKCPELPVVSVCDLIYFFRGFLGLLTASDYLMMFWG